MEQKIYYISRHASVMHRLSHIYFDLELSRFKIGCGQQFFLLRIADKPGISLLSLAQEGYFDKGTTARAVKKLEAEGYVRRITDEKDKRIIRLYATEKAQCILPEIRRMMIRWHELLTGGLSEKEQAIAGQLMERMAENAHTYLKGLKTPAERGGEYGSKREETK